MSPRCTTAIVPGGPTTPSIQRSQPITYRRFRLFPFRSPLLRESISLSFPPGTKMFQFPGCPLLDASPEVTEYYPRRVPPFRYLRIEACLQIPEAFRCLPRLSSALCAKASTVCPYSFPSFASLISPQGLSPQCVHSVCSEVTHVTLS